MCRAACCVPLMYWYATVPVMSVLSFPRTDLPSLPN